MLGFSSCQTDDYSSAEEEENEDRDIKEWEVEDELTDEYSGKGSDSEEETTAEKINPSCPGVVAEGHSAYDGLNRGAVAALVKEQLKQCGAFRGEQDLPEDVVLSPYGDIQL